MKFPAAVFAMTLSSVSSDPLYMDYQVQEDYVPILGYHQIGDFTSSLTIELADFRDQVDYLTNTMNCNWMTMTDLTGYIVNGNKLPTNTCIMNFDDGNSEQYHLGLCTLNEHSVPATYYIAPLNLDTSGFYMTDDEVQKLYAIGHDIAAHTLNHARLSDLTYADQEVEINGCKTELESRGYSVDTFAYPFGAYNDDTLDILRNSDYVLTRDTSQDNSWKDKRTPVVSFNDDFDLHFYYIKPEGYSGSQLADIIKYTGWWQFEDNFKTVTDADGDVVIRSSSSFLSTTSSMAILLVNDAGDEISTQFITKYSGGFTLGMFLYKTASSFGVTVDGVSYTPVEFDSSDPNYLQATSPGGFSYSNYYVNIPSLSPGVHVLNVENTLGGNMYLDKFRLWSDTDQDFSDPSSYASCNPSTDDYCDCDSGLAGTPGPVPTPPTPTPPSPVPGPGVADPTCANGILKDNICCMSICQSCGGVGCSLRPGSGSGCCGGTILATQESCAVSSAPCFIEEDTGPTPTPPPISPGDPDPTCSTGILKGTTCCDSACELCGGPGCSLRPGGSGNCCGNQILATQESCNVSSPPCYMEDEPVVPSDPTCSFGIISGDICCPSGCGSCTGTGCGSRPGGSSQCCATQIRASGLSCDSHVSPCIVGL